MAVLSTVVDTLFHVSILQTADPYWVAGGEQMILKLSLLLIIIIHQDFRQYPSRLSFVMQLYLLKFNKITVLPRCVKRCLYSRILRQPYLRGR